jgi:hypothetical protein
MIIIFNMKFGTLRKSSFNVNFEPVMNIIIEYLIFFFLKIYVYHFVCMFKPKRTHTTLENAKKCIHLESSD